MVPRGEISKAGGVVDGVMCTVQIVLRARVEKLETQMAWENASRVVLRSIDETCQVLWGLDINLDIPFNGGEHFVAQRFAAV